MTTQTLTNIVLSSGLAIGIFITFMAYANVKARQTGVQRLRSLMETDEEAGSVVPHPRMSMRTFAGSWQAGGLDRALKQADLQVSKSAFVRVGLLGAAGGFALTYVILGGILTSAFAGLVVFLLYLRWLFLRRDKLAVEYEEGLADAAASMAVGAQLGGGTAQGAISNAAQYAPDMVAEDLEMVSRRLVQGEDLEKAFFEVQQRRQSPMLNILVSTLIGWERHGADRPLGQILEPLTETIRENAATRKKVTADLTGVRTQMQILAIAPFVLAAMMRFTSLDYANFYASFWGEITMMGSFFLSFIGVVIGERMLNQVNQVMDLGSEE
jgi:Flp pilus assembly protein TadB